VIEGRGKKVYYCRYSGSIEFTDMREEMKKAVLAIAALMWDRRLSDNAGGNISMRDGDTVCITPRLMGYRLHWDITDNDLSIVDLSGKILEGPEKITREGSMHLGLYREFPNAGAVIHAHPYWTNVFVAKGRPIIPALQTTEKFGTIDALKELKGYSDELAQQVILHFLSKKEQWQKGPLEVILTRHGIVAMGKDLNECFDIVDRVESDCRCQILGKLLDIPS
jgi:L-fuculose-phosphate aldolase